MKKNVWLYLILAGLLILMSCRPAMEISIPNTPDNLAPIDISRFKISEDMANKMMKSYRARLFISRKRPNYFIDSPGVREQIIKSCQDPDCQIVYIFARYDSDTSQSFYRDHIVLSKDPDAWKVKRYTTLITRVTENITPKGKGYVTFAQVTYYNYVKICPPPQNGCN